MARQFGVRVHDVSLSAVGGIARMELLPVEPRAEVLISLAGPAANIAVAVALAPVVLMSGIVSGFSSAEEYALTVFDSSPLGLVSTLLYANCLIVVFNLLPAFPMDGGRIFRAGLTKILGRSAGTRVAVVVGEVFAMLLLIFSILVVQSVILALLAIFIMIVAFAEDRAVRVESAMRRLRVGQFALWDMGGLSPDQPLAYALRGGPRDVAVTVEGRVVGMLWRNELLAELSRTASGRTVGDVMDRNAISVDVDTPILEVQQLLAEGTRWAIPVTEAGRYRGVFTADRFLHVYRQLTPDPIRELRELLNRGPLERLRA
jgi:Zn-dependent protease